MQSMQPLTASSPAQPSAASPFLGQQSLPNVSSSAPDVQNNLQPRLSLSSSLSDATLTLATATALPSSPGNQLLQPNDRLHQLEVVLRQKMQENSQLQQRVQDLEALVQEQLGNSQAQANAIKKLQAQVVLLEERLRLTTDCTERLQMDNRQLSSTNEQLQQRASLLQQHLVTAVGSAPTADIAAAPAAAPSVSQLAAAARAASAASVSAFAAAGTASADSLAGLSAAAAMPAAAGSGINSSTNSPLQAMGMNRAHSMSHTPLSHSLGFNPNSKLPAKGLAGTVGLLASPREAAGGGLSLSPHPHSLSSLTHNLSLTRSMSAALQQPQQHPVAAGRSQHGRQHGNNSSSSLPQQTGIAAAAAAGATGGNTSSSKDFTRDAEVWPLHSRPNRSHSLLSARELGAAADCWAMGGAAGAADATGSSSSNPLSPAAAAAAAAAAAVSTGRSPAAVSTPPQPIIPHSHGRHSRGHAHITATGLGNAAGAQDASWPLALSASGGGPSSSTSAFALSPASWEHPTLLAGRQGSLLDTLPPHAGHNDAASAAATAAAAAAEQLSMTNSLNAVTAAAASAAAAATGLMTVPSDRVLPDSLLAGLLPFDLERLVTEGSLGASTADPAATTAAAATAAAAAAAAMGARHGSVEDLQQALMAQQFAAAAAVAQHQQQQSAAAAVAAVAALQQQQVGGATMRGGKPIPVPGLPISPGSAAAAAAALLSSSMGGAVDHPAAAAASNMGLGSSARSLSGRARALTRAASGPVGLQLDRLGDADRVLKGGGFGGSSGSARSSAAAAVKKEASPKKWDDSWAPEPEHTSSNDSELPDTDDTSYDQDTPTAPSSRSATAGGAGGNLGSSSNNAGGLLRSSSSATALQPPLGNAAAAAAAASGSSGGGAADADNEGTQGQELDAAAQNARLRSKQDASPNTCVYVGFLGWWVTERDLIEYFSPYGELVSVRLLISKKSRRSREQAFVEYAQVEQAQRAITWLDTIDYPALVKQLGCGGLVVRFADRKKPSFEG